MASSTGGLGLGFPGQLACQPEKERKEKEKDKGKKERKEKRKGTNILF